MLGVSQGACGLVECCILLGGSTFQTRQVVDNITIVMMCDEMECICASAEYDESVDKCRGDTETA